MKPQPLNTEAVSDLAAAKGINSVSELARRCDISQSYLARIMSGKRPAQPSLVVKLEEVLEVDRRELLRQEASAAS